MNSRERAEEIADAQLWNWDPDVDPVIRRAFRDNMLVPAIQRAIVNEASARELAEAKLAEVSVAWGKAVTRAEKAESRIDAYAEMYEKAAKDFQAAAARLESKVDRNEEIEAASSESLELALSEWQRRAMEAEDKLAASMVEAEDFRTWFLRAEQEREALAKQVDAAAKACAAYDANIGSVLPVNSIRSSRVEQIKDLVAERDEARRERDEAMNRAKELEDALDAGDARTPLEVLDMWKEEAFGMGDFAGKCMDARDFATMRARAWKALAKRYRTYQLAGDSYLTQQRNNAQQERDEAIARAEKAEELARARGGLVESFQVKAQEKALERIRLERDLETLWWSTFAAVWEALGFRYAYKDLREELEEIYQGCGSWRERACTAERNEAIIEDHAEGLRVALEERTAERDAARQGLALATKHANEAEARERSANTSLEYFHTKSSKYREMLIDVGIKGMGYGHSKDCDVPFDGPCGCGANHPLYEIPDIKIERPRATEALLVLAQKAVNLSEDLKSECKWMELRASIIRLCAAQGIE